MLHEICNMLHLDYLTIKFHRDFKRMKLRLPFVAIVPLTFFIGLTWANSYGREGPIKGEKICTRSYCKKAAEDLKRHMDTTVKPCEDFYKFTCGKFLKEAKIPDDKERISAFTETQNKLDENLREMFENNECNDCPHYDKYLKDYYKSCMDTDKINRSGAAAMLEMFSEFGGWPLVDESWDESKANLTNVMTTMLKYNLMNLFNVHVYSDEKNSSIHTIFMYQRSLTFPKEDYADEKQKNKTDALKTLITNVAKTLQITKTNSDKTEEDVNEVFEFETNLSKIMYPAEQTRHLDQENIALTSLADKFKEVADISVIVKKLFEGVNIEIKPDELIGIYGMDYFDNLAELLKETSTRTVINYLTWKMFFELLITMPQEYEDYATAFFKVTRGIPKEEARWKRCSSLVSGEMYKAMGVVYAKEHFDKSAKNKVKEIIKEVRKSFRNMILDVQWLTNETQSSALNKLNKMREHIGYPDYYDTEKDLFVELFDKIKNVDLNSTNFLRKHLNFLAIVMDENFKLLRKAVDKDKPNMEVAIIDAYYSAQKNTMVYPAGILQWPFFSEDIPMYLNYGGIGSAIGHEITHGFDDKGRKFDETGSLHDWWNEDDKTKFANAGKCLVEMYSNFVVENLNVTLNGNISLGENIADNGGLKAAFVAYKNWKLENGEEAKLPDLDFTPDQLFFIHFGRMYCEKTRPEAAAVHLKENYHTPGQFRVTGSLMNLKEFSDVFGCENDSRMNPEMKCRVW